MLTRGRKTLLALFGCYGLLMLYLLFVRNRSAVDGLPYWTQVTDNCSLAPFRTIRNYCDILIRREYYLKKWEAAAIYNYHARQAVINLGGNVGMFVPLGFFLPAVSDRLGYFRKTLGGAAGIIAAVELLQLFTLRGRCDIDDLILNLVGVSLGWCVWKLWKNIA